MKKFLAISGGVGGAKLGLGLTKILSEDQLSFLVNTGDDFKHAGVNISPDIDTLMYTLSGLSNQELGWGRADESWAFLDSFKTLGGESWFQLGDPRFVFALVFAVIGLSVKAFSKSDGEA